MELVVQYKRHVASRRRPERMVMTPEELGQFLSGVVLERLKMDGLLVIVTVRGASEISSSAARVEVFRKPEGAK